MHKRAVLAIVLAAYAMIVLDSSIVIPALPQIHRALPVTLPNVAAAIAIPRLTSRYGNPTVLVGGLLISATGMLWLSRLGPDTAYLTGIAFLPARCSPTASARH